MPRPTAAERIAARSEPAPNGCRLWKRATDSQGYGRLWVAGVQRRAHRVAFELAHGKIARGLLLRHTCDTPSCVNPDHLVVGSHADNMRDMVERGRSQRGEGHYAAKLAEADVRQIRARYAAGGVLQRQLAAEYGVSSAQVSSIITRRTWRHLPDQTEETNP